MSSSPQDQFFKDAMLAVTWVEHVMTSFEHVISLFQCLKCVARRQGTLLFPAVSYTINSSTHCNALVALSCGGKKNEVDSVALRRRLFGCWLLL